MITLNGKKFAETDSEFMDSLFHKGGTCIGYAKRKPHEIQIMDMRKNIIGVINCHGVLCHARKLDNGKIWYTLATIDQLGEYPYGQKQADIAALVAGKDAEGGLTNGN